MNDEEWTPIRIEAPLPLSVAGTLMQLIGAAWPEAVIDTRGSNRYSLSMRVPKTQPKEVTQEEIEQLFQESDEDDGEFLGFRNENDSAWVAFAPPEELCLKLGEIAHAIFAAHQPEAVNHVEWEVRTGNEPDDPKYVLSISTRKDRTPLAMRKAAEAEVDRLTALLEKHGIDPKEAP